MKVCFLAGTLGRGGAERQLLYMLKALKGRDISTKVLCLTSGEAFEREIRSLGVPVEWIGKASNRPLRLLTVVDRLRKYAADIIQSTHFYTNIYAGLSGRALGIPSIGAIRSDFTTGVAAHGHFGRWQVSLPRFLIVNSQLAYRRAVESGVSPERIEFVRNAVEISGGEFRGETKSGSSLKILFVGRLDRDKRPDRFVYLASVLANKFPTVRLKFQIVGGGELADELRDLAEDLRLPPSLLEFSGSCSDMDSVYRHADILVSTSVREGTSNVLLEAMTHGLAVVGTRTGGTPEILDNTRGILIEPDNEAQLIDATSTLILDNDLRRRIGSRGRQYVESHHSINHLQKQLTQIYERLTKGGI